MWTCFLCLVLVALFTLGAWKLWPKGSAYKPLSPSSAQPLSLSKLQQHCTLSSLSADPFPSITKRKDQTSASSILSFASRIEGWNPQKGLQGYLWKKSSNIFSGWQCRYFETDLRLLVYYHSRKQIDAIVDLSKIQKVSIHENGAKESSGMQREFCLHFIEGSNMHLRASSFKETNEWVTLLSRAVGTLQSAVVAQSLPPKEEEFCPLIEKGDLAGMRLNNFAGIPSLDFTRDVLSKVSPSEQIRYTEFSLLMDVALQNLLTSCKVDASRFYQAPDEFTKLRFLQSDKFDTEKAIKRLSDTIVWRQASGLDDFITNPDFALLNRYRHLRVRRIVGADRLGRPILVERLGEFMGSDEAYLGLTVQQYLTCYAYDGSQLFACFRRQVLQGHPFNHSVSYIADITGLKFSTTMKMVPFFTSLTEVVERHFVEIGGPCLVLNAPSMVVNVLWPLYRKSLDDSIVSKVTICGQDGHGQVERLFGADNVPTDFCGQKPLIIPHIPKRIDAEFDVRFPRDSLFPGLAHVSFTT